MFFGTGKGALHCGAHAGGALADVDNFDLYLFRNVYTSISRGSGRCALRHGPAVPQHRATTESAVTSRYPTSSGVQSILGYDLRSHDRSEWFWDACVRTNSGNTTETDTAEQRTGMERSDAPGDVPTSGWAEPSSTGIHRALLISRGSARSAINS